jgi:hypothetical protein
MLKKLLVLLFVGSCFLAAVSERAASKPRLCIDLLGVGRLYSHGVTHLGKFLVFFGPIGVGTVAFDHNDLSEIKNGSVSKADTNFIWRVSTESFTSHFPVIIDYMPYHKQLIFGDLSLHGYIKYSFWTSAQYSDPEIVGEYYDEYEYHDEYTGKHFQNYFYRVYKCPSSCTDMGVCLLLSPFRFVSFWLGLGVQRLNYAYHIPESFKERKIPVPGPIETHFYISYGISIGYWGIR